MYYEDFDLPLEEMTPDELTEELGAAVLVAQGLRCIPIAPRLGKEADMWQGWEYPDLPLDGSGFSDEFKAALVLACGHTWLNEVWLTTLPLPKPAYIGREPRPFPNFFQYQPVEQVPSRKTYTRSNWLAINNERWAEAIE